MQLSKSIILPILGIIALGAFNILSYLNGAIFLDRISICSLILVFIFIAKLREHAQETTIKSPKRNSNNLLRRSS